MARRGLLERAIGLRLSGFVVAVLERRSGFQSGFLTMAVLLIALGAFFSVFGGLGNCIDSSEKHRRAPRYEHAPLRDKKWQTSVCEGGTGIVTLARIGNRLCKPERKEHQ